jgi:DNA-binding PadR family transcriptional regulator
MRHGGHRGGRRRMFDSGALRLTLLLLLEDQPRHGYDFIRVLEERTGGAYAPSPGIIYPTLTLLQDIGHIEETTLEGARRLFSITDAGRAHLAAHREEAEAAMARLDALGAENSRTESGPVWRAMQNLKLALQQRLSGSTDRQIAFDAAALIDEAARKIERL